MIQIQSGIRQNTIEDEMKKLLVGVLIGLLIGWLTFPTNIFADSEVYGYMNALRKVIALMQQILVVNQQTADNTKAIRDKLGAK